MNAQPDMLTAALTYAREGFFVFPCVASGKEPACANGMNDATTDVAQITAWWNENPRFNVAVAPDRSGMFVLDVDPPIGADTLAKLELEHGLLPATLTDNTPRGGFHHWYKGSCTSSVGTERTGLGPKLDTRGVGGYVLVPPSIVQGKSYEWQDGDGTIADAPAWIAETIGRRKEKHEASGAGLDLLGNVSRAVDLCERYVRAGDVAVEGNGGDDRTYRLACEVLNLGLTPQKAWEVIRDHWNEHCIPPWDEDELAVKVRNADSYKQNGDGAWAVPSGAETFAAFAAKYASESTAEFAPVPFGTVLTREVPPVQELIAGLVEKRTVTFLSAPGGSHKSRLAVQWGLSINAGVPIFGRAVEPSRFVYLSYEDHADEVARRAQAIARRLALPLESDGQFWDLSGKDAPLAIVYESGEIAVTDFGKNFVAYLKSIAGHKFEVVDSTYNALRFVGAAKINEGAVMAAIGFLQHICDETDSTMLVLWHPSQAGQERGDASGWSVAWHNAPRARLSLGPVKDTEDAFDLRVEKRNHGPKGKPITLHWSNGVLLPRSETDTAEQKDAFVRAMVRVATMAAKAGAPIQRQKRLSGWQVDEIEREIGRRPTDREAKEVLAAALPAGLLRYIAGSQRRTAGYYPPDESSEELAREAKRYAKEGEGHE